MADDIQKTIGSIRAFRNKPSTDMSAWQAYFGTVEWDDQAGVQKMYKANHRRAQNRSELLHELTTDAGGESISVKMNAQKKDKKTKAQADVLSNITEWAQAREWGTHTYGEIMDKTEAELKRRGATPETVALWEDMRAAYDRALWKLIKPMLDFKKEIDAKAQAAGKQPEYPTFETGKGKNGEPGERG
jgi:hypothetical protein